MSCKSALSFAVLLHFSVLLRGFEEGVRAREGEKGLEGQCTVLLRKVWRVRGL